MGSLALLTLAGGGFAVHVARVSSELPEVTPLLREAPVRTSYMRRESEAGRLPAEHLLTWTPLDAMSGLLSCAIIKSEDAIFFQHQGINYRQTWAAVKGRLSNRRVGHSTITMQLARNLFLGPERTFDRKLRELILARELERELPKHRILELYLNVMELGTGVWGVPQASQHYFQKSPAELDAFEATLLGAIAPAPRRPLEGEQHERARKKQATVLWRLYISGLIGPEAYQAAVQRHQLVFQALKQQLPLREALLRPVPADAPSPSLPMRMVQEQLPAERMLDEACGYQAELRVYTSGQKLPRF